MMKMKTKLMSLTTMIEGSFNEIAIVTTTKMVMVAGALLEQSFMCCS